MTKRQVALEHIRIAAAQGDMHKATRLYAENRVSFTAFQEAVATGRAQAKALAAR